MKLQYTGFCQLMADLADAKLAERKESVRLAKQALEGQRQEVARLCEEVATRHASLQLARSQLASALELLKQVRLRRRSGADMCAKLCV